jgi:hypothetical protein
MGVVAMTRRLHRKKAPTVAPAADDLPPARAALSAHGVTVQILTGDLSRLQAAQAKLASDIAKGVEARRALQAMIDRDSSTLVQKLKQGLDWPFSSSQSAHMNAKVEASTLESQIAENASRELAAEIATLEARLADLAERNGMLVKAALVESAEGFYVEYSEAVEGVRQGMVILSALERLLGTERLGRPIGTLPDYRWTQGMQDQPVIASSASISAAVAKWNEFAREVANDPRAPIDTLNFGSLDGEPDLLPYESLSPLERRRIDIARSV